MAGRDSKRILEENARKQEENVRKHKVKLAEIEAAAENTNYKKVPIASTFLPYHRSLNSYGLSKPNPEGYCGEITVLWSFETPVVVGEASDQKDEYGNIIFGPAKLGNRFVIPGSSMRGAIRSVCNILAFAKPEDNGVDFVSKLFGYVLENDATMTAEKGRVAFEHCTLLHPETVRNSRHSPDYTHVFQSAPKSKKPVRRRYQPKYPQEIPFVLRFEHIKKQMEASAKNKNATMLSPLVLLEPTNGVDEIKFQGRIRFHNCTRSEIGLVLEALSLSGCDVNRHRHMFGRAKPFGMGQARVKLMKLDFAANDNKIAVPSAKPEEVFKTDRGGWLISGSHSMAYFTEAFREELSRIFPDYEKEESYLAFLESTKIL